MIQRNLASLEAFCQNCPDVQQVTTVLKPLGFSLVFHLPAHRATLGAPALPAQYHYQNSDGTEIIYLAGKDQPTEEGVQFPPHQSHWWVHPSASHYAYNLAIQVLTSHWFLVWFVSKEQQVA